MSLFYARLKDKSWGIRSNSEPHPNPGDVVSVETIGGRTDTVTVGRLVWGRGRVRMYRIASDSEATTMETTLTIEGKTIQHDASGQGHCWRDIAAEDVPANIQEEIAGEIVDGGLESGEMVASNGLHYRW